MVEEKTEKKTRSLTTPILVVLAAIVAFLGGMFLTRWLGSKEGKTSQQVAQVSPSSEEGAVLGELKTTIGGFSVTEEEVCQEDDKPLVYFFGRSSCPHCSWEHPIFEKVAAKFEGLISFHNNMDDAEADSDVFQKYNQINQNGIPFIVLGCRYARVGSGEGYGEEKEADYLTALICQLTEGQPEALCETVTDLIE